ncbi:hypothetical protein GCM10011509_29550 [Ornithinimicrobium pekingense]|uniref:DUF7668 domain-containing protein n=1 Tax=Ornithinimicrobium pekingense TaxID=384677 RepID=A0ABQ2FAZ5_9MICO|nr:hypothetical protein GCM10011509_29550 [Ornithinimicrobium pekingense]
MVSAVGGVVGALSAGELSLVAGRGGLSVDQLREGLVGCEDRLRPYPDALWSWLDELLALVPVEGTRPVEHETVVPLWTDEGAAQLGLRLRLVPVGRRGYLDARVVGFEEIDPAPEWSGFAEGSVGEPATSLAVPGDTPVPERWRPALREVVSRLARGDFDGLARDGVLAPVRHPSHEMVREGLQGYPDRLVELPADPWPWSDFTPADHGPGRYAVVLPLWTAGQSPSDLSLEADIDDRGADDVRVQVIGAHVL